MSEYKFIRAEKNDEVIVLTLLRIDRLNASLCEQAEEMFQALGRLVNAGAILIAGIENISRWDLGSMTQGPVVSSIEQARYRVLASLYEPVIQKVADLAIPTVAAVTEAGVGIGFSLALACDFAIAGTSAYFAHGSVAAGLTPGVRESLALTRRVGQVRALEMMLLSESMGAEQAAAWNLIYKSVADNDVMDEALALAERLAAVRVQARKDPI